MSSPSDLGAVSICRDRLDRLKPCAFIGNCSRETQELHHRLNLRGRACCFYVLSVERVLNPKPVSVEDTERTAIQGETR